MKHKYLIPALFLTAASGQFAQSSTTQGNQNSNGGEIKPLSKTEIQQMKLLRLWHTKPVVEGFQTAEDQRSATGLVKYIPDQIAGFNARILPRPSSNETEAKGGVAQEMACLDSKTDSNRGVVNLSGPTIAVALEPKISRPLWNDRPMAKDQLRFAQGTSIQVGQDFSIGGWVKFHKPSVNIGSKNRAEMMNMVPGFYTLIGKTGHPYADAKKQKDLNQQGEWQLYVNNEMLYFHSFHGSHKANYFLSNRDYLEYQRYEDCRNAGRSEPPIPLKGKNKPVPVPQEPPPQCEPPRFPPPPVNPPPGGGTKAHFYDYNLKQFAWAETFGASYIGGAHYESWHFINISLNLSNTANPYLAITIIASPYMDGRGPKASPKNWVVKTVNTPLRDMKQLEQLNTLFNESDSPIVFGAGPLGSNSRAESDQMNLRSGTYIARSALGGAEVKRMAELLYPTAAANCSSRNLVKVK